MFFADLMPLTLSALIFVKLNCGSPTGWESSIASCLFVFFCGITGNLEEGTKRQLLEILGLFNSHIFWLLPELRGRYIDFCRRISLKRLSTYYEPSRPLRSSEKGLLSVPRDGTKHRSGIQFFMTDTFGTNSANFATSFF